MSTRPGSTLSAIALASLGPDPPDEPELPPVLPLLPWPPKKGKPPEFPFPEPTRGWKPLDAGAAEGFELDQAAWPMPTPAARTASAAPPTRRPLRCLWSRFVPGAPGAVADGQYGEWGSVGGPP